MTSKQCSFKKHVLALLPAPMGLFPKAQSEDGKSTLQMMLKNKQIKKQQQQQQQKNPGESHSTV